MVKIIVGEKVVKEKQLSKIRTKAEKRAVEKKKNKLMKTLGRLARKKVQSKRTFKKSKTTLHLKQREVPSILGDTNRFFKDEMEEAKDALFFR